MGDSEIKPRALLKRAARLPVWADVTLRLSVAFFLIAFVILIQDTPHHRGELHYVPMPVGNTSKYGCRLH